MNQSIDIFFEGLPEKNDVLLLASPLFWTKTPLLSIHSLLAVCRQAGITTHVLYSNLLYSIITGAEIHFKIAREGNLFLGERLFASSAFGHSAVSGVMGKFSHPDWLPDHAWKIKPRMANQVPEVFAPFREWIGSADWEHLESRTTHWVHTMAQRIVDKGYRVVGCSTSPGGLVPAIALLDYIKKMNDSVITVLGGGLCEGEMAEGILSLKAGIDYVFSGEGELTFPDFVKKVLAGNPPEGKIIYGESVTNLDAIPTPDYGDYFDQLEKLPPQNRPSPDTIEIPYETSRGCWYGKCLFCSFYGKKNFYREKSPDQVLSDLKSIVGRHGIHNRYFLMDNIMPLHFFGTLLPRVSKDIPDINIFYQIKANLTLEQVISLKKAGVNSIGPGIESFSTSMLKRMKKGLTARENIALLRYACSVKMEVLWVLLFDFPGDKVEEYEEMLRLLPLIRHLPAPRWMNSLVIWRFSQYHKFPETFGISNLRPSEFYETIFPLHADLEEIAYYFTGDYPTQSHEHPEIVIALAKEIKAWNNAWAIYNKIKIYPLESLLPVLHITRKSEDEYILQDTRGLPGCPKQMVLNREQTSILLVPRPQGSADDFHWAVDAQLGILMDSWFIPLATAEPELLLEFERGYESGG